MKYLLGLFIFLININLLRVDLKAKEINALYWSTSFSQCDPRFDFSPLSLFNLPRTGLNMIVGASAQAELFTPLDKVMQFVKEHKGKSLTSAEKDEFKRLLKALEKCGLSAELPQLGFIFTSPLPFLPVPHALSLSIFPQLGVNIKNIDTQNLDIATQNTTTIDFGVIGKGIIGLTAAYELPYLPLRIGGKLKYMLILPYLPPEPYVVGKEAENPTIENWIERCEEEKPEPKGCFSFDIATSYKTKKIPFEVSLLIIDLLSPTIQTKEGRKIDFSPLVKLSCQYKLLRSLRFAGDIDLTEEKLPADLKRQILSASVIYAPLGGRFNLILGGCKDLARKKSSTLLCAGIGLKIPIFLISFRSGYDFKEEAGYLSACLRIGF
jgi:hypothetical protein